MSTANLTGTYTASTLQTSSFASSYAIQTSQTYAIGVICNATTQAALIASTNAQSPLFAVNPRLTGATSGTDLPASILSTNVSVSGALYWFRLT